MGCFVVAEFLVTSASCSPSTIAEPLVKMVAVRNLGFSNFQIFCCQSGWNDWCASLCKFYQNRSSGYWYIAFNNFPNGAIPSSWIFKNLIYWTGGKLWRTNICHRSIFHQNQPNSCGDIAIFWFLRWPQSTILDSQIYKFLVCHQIRRPNMHRRTDFFP